VLCFVEHLLLPGERPRMMLRLRTQVFTAVRSTDFGIGLGIYRTTLSLPISTLTPKTDCSLLRR
jgi:hypothetical protein